MTLSEIEGRSPFFAHKDISSFKQKRKVVVVHPLSFSFFCAHDFGEKARSKQDFCIINTFSSLWRFKNDQPKIKKCPFLLFDVFAILLSSQVCQKKKEKEQFPFLFSALSAFEMLAYFCLKCVLICPFFFPKKGNNRRTYPHLPKRSKWVYGGSTTISVHFKQRNPFFFIKLKAEKHPQREIVQRGKSKPSLHMCKTCVLLPLFFFSPVSFCFSLLSTLGLTKKRRGLF